MKKIFVFIAIVALGLHSYSQDEIQTIFDGDVSISGFGGPFMSFTSLNGDFAHMMGGGGGVLISQSLFFGGFGMGNTTQHFMDYTNPHTSEVFNDLDIDFGYGGFYFGYIFFPTRAIHPAVFLQTGWGDISLNEDGSSLFNDNVFVLNPSLQLEINFTRFFRMGVGVNYQYVNGVNLNGLSNNDFTSPGGFLSFKFGWF